MTSNIVIDALLLFHGDRGSQYASGVFNDVLKEYGILSSMSPRGNCWDAAGSETLFGSLKIERLDGQRFVTRRQAKDETIAKAALVQQGAAAFDAGLRQPDAVRKRMACQASQLMSSVMGTQSRRKVNARDVPCQSLIKAWLQEKLHSH